MKQPRIMFVTYGAGHVDIVARLLPAIAGQNLPEPVVLGLTTAPMRLTDSACTLRRCADYLPLAGYEEALSKGAVLAKSFWVEGSIVPWEETCAYLGVSMCDLERKVGHEAAKVTYEKSGRKAFCPVRFMECVLERERPDIVVTTCHVRMERAATIAARNLGIRSVLIEDLLGYSLLGPYPYGKAGALIPSEEWPDMAVVMNAAVKDIVAQNGFPRQRVVPFGQPVFSEWKLQYGSAQPSCLFGQDVEARPLVTYVATPQDEILDDQSKMWIDLARRRPDLNFAIKLHPSTAEETYRKRHDPFPDNLRILSKESVLNLIKASDLVVLFRSTVGMLCLMTSTPMIVWDTTQEAELLPYVVSGAAELAETDKDLEPLIEKMLLNTSSGGVPPAHPLFDMPADAAARIAGWLAVGAPECENDLA